MTNFQKRSHGVKRMFSGSSCAGAVAAGVACFFIGLVTLLWGLSTNTFTNSSPFTLLEASAPIIITSLIIWLWGWYFLHSVWRSQAIRRRLAYRIAMILVIAGMTTSMFSIFGIAIS